MGDDLELPALGILRGHPQALASEVERQHCRSLSEHIRTNTAFRAPAWLEFSRDHERLLSSPQAVTNLFLLGLWLQRPTWARVAFIFAHPGLAPHLSEIRGGFQWIWSSNPSVKDKDLLAASDNFSRLATCYAEGRRLRFAIAQTIAACSADRFSVAVVLLTSAVEAMLTYKRGGTGPKLADFASRLVEADTKARRKKRKQVSDLYDYRSDLMHGRSYLRTDEDLERKEMFVRFSEVVRLLWKQILVDSRLRKVLQETDEDRERYFKDLRDSERPAHA